MASRDICFHKFDWRERPTLRGVVTRGQPFGCGRSVGLTSTRTWRRRRPELRPPDDARRIPSRIPQLIERNRPTASADVVRRPPSTPVRSFFRHIPQAPFWRRCPDRTVLQIRRKLPRHDRDETERPINERVMFGPAVTGLGVVSPVSFVDGLVDCPSGSEIDVLPACSCFICEAPICYQHAFK